MEQMSGPCHSDVSRWIGCRLPHHLVLGHWVWWRSRGLCFVGNFDEGPRQVNGRQSSEACRRVPREIWDPFVEGDDLDALWNAVHPLLETESLWQRAEVAKRHGTGSYRFLPGRPQQLE